MALSQTAWSGKNEILVYFDENFDRESHNFSIEIESLDTCEKIELTVTSVKFCGRFVRFFYDMPCISAATYNLIIQDLTEDSVYKTDKIIVYS